MRLRLFDISSRVTYNDGSSAVMVMERENAESLGIKPLARFVGFAVGSIPPEMMGIGGGHL